MLVIFTALFIGQMFFHVFKGISPLQYVQMPSSANDPSTAEAHETPETGVGTPHDTIETHETRRPRRRRHNKQFIPDVLRRDSGKRPHFGQATFASASEVRTTQPSGSGTAYGSTQEHLLHNMTVDEGSSA